MSGERSHASAWRTALDSQLGDWSAYDYDDVPETLPSIYVLITVERRYGGDPRLCGRKALKGWRMTTRAVGRTVDEARWARERVAALEYSRVAISGASPLEFEDETTIEADADRFSGLTTWTYSTT